MSKIAPRQLYFFFACIAPLGKLVLLPTQLAQYSANDLLFPAAINFLLQASVIFLIMLLSRSNSTFFDLLVNTFGKITAKILICIFSLFLIFVSFLPILEQKLFIQSVFYDTLPSTVAFSTFFLFSAYICAKPAGVLGRTWDILAPLAIFGIVGILVFSVANADFAALAPVGVTGAKSIFQSTLYTVSWFYDSAMLLMLMGRFEYQKGMAWKSTLFYLLGAAVILLYLAIFFGIYEGIAVRQIFSFAKIGKYNSGVPVLGRIDYLFIFALTLGLSFYCTMPLHLGVTCLVQAFGGGKYRPALFSVGANLIIFILTILMTYHFATINKTVNETLCYLFLVFCVLIPAFALLLRRKPREKV